MYNEKKMRFWAIMEIIKKWFIIAVLTGIGFVVGFVISEFVVDVLNELPMYRTAFIGGTAFVGFFLGLLLTSNVERNVQDAFWKIEVMHRLEEIGNDELSRETGLALLLEKKPTIAQRIKNKFLKNKENKESANTEKTSSESSVEPVVAEAEVKVETEETETDINPRVNIQEELDNSEATKTESEENKEEVITTSVVEERTESEQINKIIEERINNAPEKKSTTKKKFKSKNGKLNNKKQLKR